MTTTIDLGLEHRFSLYVTDFGPWYLGGGEQTKPWPSELIRVDGDQLLVVVGAVISHPRRPAAPSGMTECAGSVLFDLPGVATRWPGRARWTIVSTDPWTLQPSVKCSLCGDHGYVKDGQWQPA